MPRRSRRREEALISRSVQIRFGQMLAPSYGGGCVHKATPLPNRSRVDKCASPASARPMVRTTAEGGDWQGMLSGQSRASLQLRTLRQPVAHTHRWMASIRDKECRKCSAKQETHERRRSGNPQAKTAKPRSRQRAQRSPQLRLVRRAVWRAADCSGKGYARGGVERSTFRIATRPTRGFACNLDARAGEQWTRLRPQARFGIGPNLGSRQFFSRLPQALRIAAASG